jgi:hypothetical protein
MIVDLIKHYDKFSDSCIKNIKYDLQDNRIILTILAININYIYKWDLIEIEFNEIIKFRFIENEKTSNSVILNALIQKIDGINEFDFYPNDNGNTLILDEESDFLIKCKEVSFKILLDEN